MGIRWIGNGRLYHDGEVFVPDAVVVDGRLEEMGVLLEPGQGTWSSVREFDYPGGWGSTNHLGRLTGEVSMADLGGMSG